MGKKNIGRERKARRKRKGLSPEDILGLMKNEDRPLLIRDILRQLDLEKEERRRVRELLKEPG